MNDVLEIAEIVTNRLLEDGFIIQRYDSITTNSVYLKLDYGVCNSIRISDHKGKKHLKYRFNLLSDREGFRVHDNSGFERRYYGFDKVDLLLNDVVAAKGERALMYGWRNYQTYMENNKLTNSGKWGFWSKSYEVQRG